jgi:uncharacterized protein
MTTTGEQHINYEALAQDAFRGIVRTVLTRVAKSGLPGNHHFYISFGTQAPGVGLSSRLRERYPEEMTIVLQYRFRDLIVTATHFEVKLTFDGIPETVVVPFAAVKVFFDPSVPYGLQFGGAEPITDTMNDLGDEDAEALGAAPRTPRVRKVQRLDSPAESAPAKKARSPKRPRAGKGNSGESAAPSSRDPAVVSSPIRTEQAANDAKVIQLDQFRKK